MLWVLWNDVLVRCVLQSVMAAIWEESKKHTVHPQRVRVLYNNIFSPKKWVHAVHTII